MSSLIRTCLAIALAVTLPLEAYVAVAMPSCGERVAAADASAGGVAGDHAHQGHCADMATADPGGGATEPAWPSLADCTACGLCHVACSAALPQALAQLSFPSHPVLHALADSPDLSVPPGHAHPPPRT
jgi:ferredoxin